MLDPVSRQLAEMQLRKLVLFQFNLIPSQQGHSPYCNFVQLFSQGCDPITAPLERGRF